MARRILGGTLIKDKKGLWELVDYYHLQRYTSATAANAEGLLIFNTNKDAVTAIGTYAGREQTNFPGPLETQLGDGEGIRISGFAADVSPGISVANADLLGNRLMLTATLGTGEDAKLMEPPPLRKLARSYLLSDIAVSGGADQLAYYAGSAFTKNDFLLPAIVQITNKSHFRARVQIGTLSTLTASTNFDLWWVIRASRLRTKSVLQELAAGGDA